MLLLERFDYAGAFIGKIRSDGDQVEVAAAEHAVSRLHIWKFIDAGAAPGRPEIHQEHFTGGIGTQLFEHGYRRIGDGHRRCFQLAEFLGAAGSFRLPLGRAAKDTGVRHGNRLASKQGVERGASILGLHK